MVCRRSRLLMPDSLKRYHDPLSQISCDHGHKVGLTENEAKACCRRAWTYILYGAAAAESSLANLRRVVSFDLLR